MPDARLNRASRVAGAWQAALESGRNPLMKFGVNTYIWGATFGPADFHLLPRIKAGGFDGIEVPILDPAAFEVEAVAREFERVGLARTAVANVPAGSSLASSDARERRRARD